MTEPCPHCDTWESDPHEPGECLLIFTGLPGALRRAWLLAHPGEQVPEPDDEPAA